MSRRYVTRSYSRPSSRSSSRALSRGGGTRPSSRSSSRREVALPVKGRHRIPVAKRYQGRIKKKASKPGPKFAGDPFRQQRNNFTVNYLAAQVGAKREQARANGQMVRGILQGVVNEYNRQNPTEQVTVNQVSKRIQKIKQIATKIRKESEPEPIAISNPIPSVPRPKIPMIKQRFKQDVTISIRDSITIAFNEYLQGLKKSDAKPPSTQKEAFEEIRRRIVDKYKLHFDCATDGNFSITAARSRINNNKLICTKSGHEPPLLEVEPYVAQLCIRASRCNNALTRMEVIELMNSLIQDTPIQLRLVNWKSKFCKVRSKVRGNEVPLDKVGLAWMNGFMKRFPEIRLKQGRNRNRNREEWCTYHNIRDMYAILFRYWILEGYIARIPIGQWQDIDGKPVPIDDPNRIGRKVYHKWLHPERMLVADETGFTTNMERDRASLRRTFRVVERGSSAPIPVATDDCHFTCMCFTNMLGVPVVMVIIIAQKEELNLNQILGADNSKPWIGDESVFADSSTTIPDEDLERNIGPGKRHHGGVTCHVNGKDIPQLVFNSDNGSITSAILRKILEHLDKLEVFERGENLPPPAVLLDGHGSRFGLDFLSYINNEDMDGKELEDVDHRWNGYIGLPNATHLWQVADSSHCNANFKEHLRRAAEEIVSNQRRYNEPIELKKHHIVPMVAKAYENSFGMVENNKTAIATRGWNPPNRNCLLNQELVDRHDGNHRYDSEDELEEEVGYTLPRGRWRRGERVTAESNVATVAAVDPVAELTETCHVARSLRDLHRSEGATTRSEGMIVRRPDVVHGLNVSNKKAFDVITDCLQSDNRNIAQERELLQRRQEQRNARRTANQQILSIPKLTAGSEHKRGNLSLNDPETARIRRLKEQLKNRMERTRKMERYLRVKKLFDHASRVKQKRTTWTVSDYAWMIRYKEFRRPKNPNEPSVLSTKRSERIARWNRVKDFPDPTPPQEPEGLEAYLEEQRRDAAEAEAAERNIERSFDHLRV